MTRQKFHLHRYGWIVYVYYDTTQEDAGEIYETLELIGCDKFDLDEAWENISSSKMNSGLTYSNFSNRESVMVIAKTTSAEEFAKSYRHEIGHLATHITSAFKLNLKGEVVQYIGDAILGKTWNIAKKQICEC